MEDQKKTDAAEPCCTVKVAVEKDAEDCCAGTKGERVIKLDCGTGSTSRTIKVVCCPDDRHCEE